MANLTTITGAIGRGGITHRFTQSGQQVASLSLGHTPRKFDKDKNEWVDAGETLWLDVSIWGDDAETLGNAYGEDTRGRATATGQIGCRYYETSAGERRMVITLRAEAIMIHPSRQGGGGQGQQLQQATPQGRQKQASQQRTQAHQQPPQQAQVQQQGQLGGGWGGGGGGGGGYDAPPF